MIGGWLLGEAGVEIDAIPTSDWVSMMIDKLAQMPHVTLLPRTTVFGHMDHNFRTLPSG